MNLAAMNLVAGTYEQVVWGFKLRLHNENETEQAFLSPIFSHHAHLSPIKALSVSGPIAASSGSDETVRVFDINQRAEIGALIHDNGAASCLAFYGFTPKNSSVNFPVHLITGSEQGSISIFDVEALVHLKSIRAHKKGVNDLTIHPTGRVGLSIGRDLQLCMTNLIKGRRSFGCKLQKEASLIRYGLDGKTFFVVTERVISSHDSEDARLLLSMENSKRVNCIAPAENGLLFTGGEDCSVRAWDPMTGKVAFSFENAHSTRLKGLVVFGERYDQGDDAPYIIASASSDGFIKVWDLRMATERPTPLEEASIKCRLTCFGGSCIREWKLSIKSCHCS
ncbi:hypothetical protein AMTRI_Chr11g152620 [Amborella trichopoda]